MDVIPELGMPSGGLESLLVPGKLLHTGPALMCTGGAVSNTGLALHRLGVPVRLMGKVGDDLFGSAVLDFLSRQGDGLDEGMIVAKGGATSYSIVINPPGVDRIFLHCPGANDTFAAADVEVEALVGGKLFHFGYPPLMRRMYTGGGSEMAETLRKVKEAGLTTSMDMAKPDPGSEAGKVDWISFMKRVLPDVDIFLPSFDELLYMLDRPLYDQLSASASGELSGLADEALLARLGEQLLAMGAAIAAIKLGENGLYLRTTADAERLNRMGRCRPGASWLGRELLSDCYRVEVAGTTGAGDCTIAGLLTGLLQGLAPEAALQSAVAVGACNVERADAVSGIPTWEDVQARIRGGWFKRQHQLQLSNWSHEESLQLWFGPADSGKSR